MNDKDLLVVISEMLRKQDRQAEILNSHSALLEKQTEILNFHSELLEKQTEILGTVNTTLSNFMNVSVSQFEQQQVFNEKFIGKLDSIGETAGACCGYGRTN